MKSWPKVKLGEVQIVRKLLRITRLADRKSYLVIICPNSHQKLTKSEIRSSSSRFELVLKRLHKFVNVYTQP